jgi:hypothetical protein
MQFKNFAFKFDKYDGLDTSDNTHTIPTQFVRSTFNRAFGNDRPENDNARKAVEYAVGMLEISFLCSRAKVVQAIKTRSILRLVKYRDDALEKQIEQEQNRIEWLTKRGVVVDDKKLNKLRSTRAKSLDPVGVIHDAIDAYHKQSRRFVVKEDKS